MKPSTIAVHVGNTPDPETGAVIAPIYQTSTFVTDAHGGNRYEYTRASNPNFTRLEETLAALEGGRHATVFGSGLGAINAILSLLTPGDHVVASEDLYGGTVRLLNHTAQHAGIATTYVAAHDTAAWTSAVTQKTRLVIVESPTNPLLQIADIAAIAREAKARGIIVAADNTFATPMLQQPLTLGASLVVHSTTKYLGGHSDVIGGAVITDDGALNERLRFARKAIGLNPSPFDCWLVARGVKTLPLRMERHAENALHLATVLAEHPVVAEVIYPGLKNHPQHALASRQMAGFGGMISVRLRATKADAERGFAKLKLFLRAESLGGVESLISHPASQTHASLSAEERARRGIGDDLWRLSVGIEDVEDLLEDITGALDAMR